MRPQKIYFLCSHGIPIATVAAKELVKKLGTAPGVVCNYARDGLIYKDQYTFQEMGLANEKTAAVMELAKEWDEVVEKILTSGR